MTSARGRVRGSNLLGANTEDKHGLGTRDGFLYKLTESTDDLAYVEAVYIKAGAALTAGDVCYLPEVIGSTPYTVSVILTKTNAATIADAQNEFFSACVPMTDLASGEYGWAAVKGIIPVACSANAAAFTKLGLTATAGEVDDADTDYELADCVPITAVGGAAAVSNCKAFADLKIYRNAA